MTAIKTLLFKKKLESIGGSVSSIETFKQNLFAKIKVCLKDGKKLVTRINAKKYSLIIDRESMKLLNTEQVLTRVVNELYRKRPIFAIKDTGGPKDKVRISELEKFLDADSARQLF